MYRDPNVFDDADGRHASGNEELCMVSVWKCRFSVVKVNLINHSFLRKIHFFIFGAHSKDFGSPFISRKFIRIPSSSGLQ
jgi:hypothetical protein